MVSTILQIKVIERYQDNLQARAVAIAKAIAIAIAIAIAKERVSNDKQSSYQSQNYQ